MKTTTVAASLTANLEAPTPQNTPDPVSLRPRGAAAGAEDGEGRAQSSYAGGKKSLFGEQTEKEKSNMQELNALLEAEKVRFPGCAGFLGKARPSVAFS